MGLLVGGKWVDRWYNTKESGGKFVREDAQFRHWITSDGRAGPSGDSGFRAESGRYHLYISHACPWAHRTMIVRQLKGLAPHISVSSVHPDMLSEGWTFETCDGAEGDALYGLEFARQLYTRCDPTYSGRVTVPILWDKERNTIVSNESSEIIRMFNTAFNELTDSQSDYYPEELRSDIDEVNERVYHSINNGVYKCGFATTVAAYEEAFQALFEALDWCDDRLSKARYLIGNVITEADWRLFTTLVRFDAVYVGHFKCNLRRIEDYPALSHYTRELYQWPGIAETINMDHIKRHYYYSHETINPTRIVPVGPALSLHHPHNRAERHPI